jgi:hypothetical protein
MKKLALSLTFIMAFGGAMHSAAQDKVFTINADDWQHLQVTFNVGDLAVGKTVIDGQTFSTLVIDGYQQPLANYGSPSLPTFSRLMEVPVGAEFEVMVSDAEYDTLEPLEYQLVPVQLPRRKSDTTAPKLCINREVYSWNAFIGQREALVEAVGIARDRRLARLQYSPVRYNPLSGKVIVCRHATVTVNYRGGDEQASKELFERYYSPAFNSGAKPINDLYPKAVRTTAPVRYVIVANSMFRGQMDDFVSWKRRKGFRTDIVYTDNPSVGSSTTSIAAYLKGLYDNATTADPAPTYVLLVGDVAQLPAFSAQVTSPSSDHVTDLYYATWTSGDHLPDCHYGRFSAQSDSQLAPQILKTLMYEQYTFADPTFLDRAVMVAGVDGGTAGDNGYTYGDPAMDYAITNYVNGTHGWSQVMYFKNNTSIVPSVMTNVTLGSSASSNAATVRSYYNQGAGFINYTAHGGSDGWGTPNFGNSHVNSMTNNQKFGLMIGNCCLTNKFEVSTCFGEALLRKDNYAGAVGYIGGSNSTYWTHDFYWAVGVRSSIEPSMSMAYNSSNLGVYDRVFHTHNEAYSQWCTTQGSIVMQGNMAVENSSSSSSYKHYYWEIYHLMGDPSVMPYMTQASVMSVAVASMVTYGTTSLPVTAAPNAYVALVDTVTETLIAAAYANASGSAVLTLPASLAVGTYLLAASAQQYRTAFTTVSVMQPAGAFPYVASITSAPLNAGDTVALTLHVENPGNAVANNIVITLASNNPMLTLSTSSVTLASLAAGASADIATGVVAYVAANAPDNSFADISTSATWTGSTTAATNTLRMWLYAPVITMSFSNDGPTVMPGASTTVTATLHNIGHAPAHANQLTFNSPTPMFTVSSTANAPFALNADGEASYTLTMQANAQLPRGITIPVNYSYGSLSGTLPVYVGQSFMETFEGGTTHFSGWSAPAAYPWAVSTEQPYEGNYCLRSVQYTSHSQNSDMNLTVNVATADSVSFYYRVSSEQGWDKFHFLIDNESQFNASGEVNWTRAAYPLSAGTHTLTFRYAKDGSVSNGSDCAWVDNVVLPHSSHPTVFVDEVLCSADTAGYPAITISADSTVTFHNYTVMPSGISYDTAEACGSYQWRGHTYTASATYGDTVAMAGGCDSLYLLTLTVHPITQSYDTLDACDHYTWEGTDYTVSANVVDHLTDVYGCDSVVMLHLAIHHTLYTTVFDTVDGDSYTWNDSVYTCSGVYRQYFTTVYGCDSIVTLLLTVNGSHEGILSLGAEKVTVYPVPTAGMVHFSSTVAEVEVLDMTGRLLGRHYDANELDLSALPRGTYMLKLTNQSGTAVCRVILQ